MKKRILSFLLVLCMLVAMVPVTAAVAEENGSTESQADAVYAENYLDLYVTEGLTVLFDANSLSSDMITFGETADSAGIWYGYTVDAATGKLVKNETYVANPSGGAYNEETNPFGWQKLQNGGIAWDEPDSKNANYYLHFTEAWLGKAFEVELVYEPYLRDTTEGFLRAETVVDYNAEELQWYVDESGKPISGVSAGLVYEDREVVERDEITGKATLFKRSTKWNSGDALPNGATNVTIYLIDGEPGETITVKGNNGTYKANEDVYAGYTITAKSGKDLGTVTFDEDGCAVISAPIYGDFFEVILPITTEALIDKVEANVYINQCAYDQTFVIGNLYAMVWSNKMASNTWSNGFGMARWSVAKGSWEGNPAANTNTDATKANMLDLSVLDDKNYGKIDDKIVTMNVANTGSQYHLSYGNASKTFTLDASKANEDGTYGGQNFKVLQQMGGAAYGMRLYKAPLTTEQKNQNHFADVAARYNLNVSEIELSAINAYDYLFREFASVALEGEDAAELQAMLDKLIDENPAKLLTDYDKMYVQDGLVALFSAYNNDASVNLTEGTWKDKTGTVAAAKFGGNRWAVNADGNGVGYAFDRAAFDAENAQKVASNYLSFSNDFFNMADVTFESVVKYDTLTNNPDSGLFCKHYPGLQLDIVQGTTFYSGSSGFSYRMGLGFYPWANHNGNNSINTMTFDGKYNTYIGNGSNVQVKAVITQTLLKDTDAVAGTVHFKLTYNDKLYATGADTGAAQYSEGTITLSDYNRQKNRYPWNNAYQMPAPYTLFNNTPGSVYAVRAYNRPLNAEEVAHNKLVDIFAYAGYDFAELSFEEIKANADLVSMLLQSGVGQSVDQIKGAIATFSKGDVEKTAYDKLYVDRGLVALYTAFDADEEGGDASLFVVGGKVVGWIDKVNQTLATVTGPFTANASGDGGFGTDRWDKATFDSLKGMTGIAFDAAYVESSNFTVDVAAMFYALSDVSAESGSYHTGVTGHRVDLFAFTPFMYTGNPHMRGVLTYRNWNDHNGANNNVIGLGGQTTGYRAAGVSYVNAKISSLLFTKATTASNTALFFSMNNRTWADLTITAEQVAQQQSVKPSESKLSFFNSAPGAMYALRVYNVVLTTTEVRQNKLVDLLAYAEADLTNYPTEATEIVLLANLIADKNWSFDTDDLKTKLEAAMEIGVTPVTYKNALTGETLKSFAEIKGEYLTLPESIGNKVVVEWDVNEDDAIANENAVYNAVVIEKPTANNGVSVRVDGEDVGLRFTTVLDKASYGDLTIKYGAENVKLGMLVSTESIVAEAGAFTKEAIDLYAAGNAGYVDIAINGYYKMTEGGDYELAGVLTNIKDSSLDAAKVKFVSVLYIEIDTDADGVSDVTVYGSASAAKSVKEVADATKAAIDAADVDSGLTAEAEATFNTWYAAKFPTAE